MHIRRSPGIALGLSLVAALSVACGGGTTTTARTATPVQPSTVSAAPTPTPTATGVVATRDSAGDPYTPGNGNGGYDVQHYDLKLKVVPSDTAKTLDAVARIKAKASSDLTAFNLDLTALKVTSVKVDGADADYEHEGSELVVKPAGSIAGGSEFTVAVAYEGTPQAINDPILGPYGWIKTSDGVAVACQPSGAHTWFPGNDHPSDKATFTIELTVPEALTAISNGESGEPRTSGGFTTSTWKVTDPMATYLAMITVGKFKVKKGTTGGGIPILVAVDTSVTSPTIDQFYNAKAKITDEWVKLFGDYPFTSTGGVIDNARVSFALETQTRSIYGDFTPDQTIIAHELAHQWFGDSVSVTEWKDIWLNEGFASYAEWLWAERAGLGTVEQKFKSLYETATPADWSVLTGDPGRTKLFDKFAIYDRGAMTLHALGLKIGKDKLLETLRTWASEHKFGNATTAQFVETAERVSGQQLDAFFQAWLYEPTRPSV